jgi:hypothetical protein
MTAQARYLVLSLYEIPAIQITTSCGSRASGFPPNISVEPYIDEFLVSPKTAVKKLTQRIREELVKVTVLQKPETPVTRTA